LPEPSRVSRAFLTIRKAAARKLPWLARTRLRHCAIADRDHKRKWRQFAHSNHYPMTVCFALDAERELTDAELRGLVGHELSHVVGETLGFPEHKKKRRGTGSGTPVAIQAEADWLATRVLGFKLRYNARTIQEIP